MRLTSLDEKFMKLAIVKARKGIARGQTPFGACIVRKGKVLCTAHNEVWCKTDITAHAEVQAIRRACKIVGEVTLKGSILFSTCEPCPMCFSACHWAGISKIIFGASIKEAHKAGFNELAISSFRMKSLGKSSLIVVGGFMKNENAELFQLWKRSPISKAY